MFPFDAAKLNRLMEDADLDLLLASTRHNVRYLTGGYYYHFHANAARMGLTQYLPFVGVPRGRVEESFYVCRAEERGQVEAAVPWITNRVEAMRGTLPAAEGVIKAISKLGLAAGTIGVELPFLPADAYVALQRGLPNARLVDATPVLNELRAIKTPVEIALLRSVYDRVAEAIQARSPRAAGITTRKLRAPRSERSLGAIWVSSMRWCVRGRGRCGRRPPCVGSEAYPAYRCRREVGTTSPTFVAWAVSVSHQPSPGICMPPASRSRARAAHGAAGRAMPGTSRRRRARGSRASLRAARPVRRPRIAWCRTSSRRSRPRTRGRSRRYGPLDRDRFHSSGGRPREDRRRRGCDRQGM